MKRGWCSSWKAATGMMRYRRSLCSAGIPVTMNIKATAENLLKKLRELSEDDCRELICDIQRNYHLPWKARTVGEMIAVARQESNAQKLEGHDIMALERFDPEVKHMIIFDVLSGESPIGDKGHRMRLFLTEVGYKKALESQDKSFIRILNHAKVAHQYLEKVLKIL